MRTRHTSIAAYREVLNTGRADVQREHVFLAIPPDGATRQELSRLCDIPLASICGRVDELRRHGVVADGSTRQCKVTGHVARVVKRIGEVNQIDLFDKNEAGIL